MSSVHDPLVIEEGEPPNTTLARYHPDHRPNPVIQPQLRCQPLDRTVNHLGAEFG